MKIPLLPSKFERENEVSSFYSEILKDLLKCPFKASFNTDGFFINEKKKIKLLAEFKFGGDFTLDPNLFLKCVCQTLVYIKKVEESGSADLFPNLIFIGNDKHFSIFDSGILIKYLSHINSYMVPSEIFQNPPQELIAALKELNTNKYNLHEFPILESLLSSYESKTIGLKMSVNNENIGPIYRNFITNNIINQKIDEHDSIHLFVSILFDEYDISIKTPNILTIIIQEKKSVKSKSFRINRNNFDAFISLLSTVNRPKSKDEIISQSDRLINEVFRRFYGEFYTPFIGGNEAHKIIEQEYGKDWKERCVAWDPSSGTLNLTRDHYFKELYCSTLYQADLDIAAQRGYNPNAVKFQYDFLNDDIYPDDIIGSSPTEDKLTRMAPGLVKALRENREIIMLFNPPYTGPGNNKRDGISKTNAGKTKINLKMLTKKIGYPSCQLHIQFLYRILDLKKKYKATNINICCFIPPLFLSGESYKEFRKIFLNCFSYKNGFLFNAGNFSQVKENWGISFLMFKSQKGQLNNFPITIKDFNGEILQNAASKIIYNTDSIINLTDWCKEKLAGEKEECIVLTNALQIKSWFEKKNLVATMYKNSLGYIGNSGNNLSDVPTYTGIYSTLQSLGFSITKDNFYRSISMFCAKSSIKINWINCKDEFCKPDENHPEFNQWLLDSIVYSLFHPSSNQSSLRNVIYKNKQWNIFNEFFWLPNQLMQDLANQHNFNELYQDTKIFNKDRFVYTELQKVLPQLSSDAIAVLNKANELVIKSFVERKNLFHIHPDWNLEAWDAGWYQIKLVLKEKFSEDLKEFNVLYKKFEDRMREGVYKFGFLK